MIKLSRKERIEQFWNWFNAHKYYYGELDSEWDPGLDQISEKLKSIDKSAYLDIMIQPSDKGESILIISADGIIDNFALVREVVNAAPDMIGWRAIAFEQPHEEGYIIRYKRYLLDPAEMYFLPFLTEDYFGVTIYGKKLKKLSEEDSFYLSNKILISIIGEYHFATKVTACLLTDISEAVEMEELLPLSQFYNFVVNNFMNRN